MSELRIVGKAEHLPGELLDKNIVDSNNERCSGLIIISDLEGLTYDANNGIVKINSKPGHDLLFISPDERVVRVYKSGYKSLSIILSEYGIKPASGKTYKIEITGTKKKELQPVFFKITPAGSRLYIDNRPAAADSLFPVSEGRHSIRIEKEGYKSFSDTITVTGTNYHFTYSLIQIEYSSVFINSVPSGARIFLNEMEKGETDKALYLEPGTYKLRLSRSGCLDTAVVITVNENTSQTFNFNLVRNEGKLKLTILPGDASVFIDMENVSGKSEIYLAPGRYKLRAEKSGYESFMEIITIKLGAAAEREVVLLQKTGGMRFNVQPYEADVKLVQNGKEIKRWTGLADLKDLLIGDYRLECRMDGYEDYIKRISIEEGKTLTVDIKLKKLLQDKYESNMNIEESSGGVPWYYYVGGAVLTGGAAAILLLKKGQEPQQTQEKKMNLPPDRP